MQKRLVDDILILNDRFLNKNLLKPPLVLVLESERRKHNRQLSFILKCDTNITNVDAKEKEKESKPRPPPVLPIIPVLLQVYIKISSL